MKVSETVRKKRKLPEFYGYFWLAESVGGSCSWYSSFVQFAYATVVNSREGDRSIPGGHFPADC